MGKRAEAGIFIEEIEAGSLSGCRGKEVILERLSRRKKEDNARGD